MNTNLQNQIINELIIIGGILAPLLTALRAMWKKSKLNELAESKIKSIKNEDLRNAAQAAYDTLQDFIPQEITNAEIALKPAILQAIADGKVTKDELCKLNGIVKDKVLSQLTDDAKKALEAKIPDINSYLTSKVETVLSKLKLDPTSVVSKTVIPEPSEANKEPQTVSLEEYQKLLNENAQLIAQVESAKAIFNGDKTNNQNIDISTNINSSEELKDTSKSDEVEA
ncbi:hypothetical protein [Clostridium beijerinckii]|uniref:hypothetical protein n=1 Tax=Clostridium beijerinckii TaxID=1520 RepID=UPI0003D3249C|nr:hypothetical protein [Clostridium beijerinckii]ALB46199.1 hypothetical protein X276_13600 [Clostridium beijerinckii NRRL B-598]